MRQPATAIPASASLFITEHKNGFAVGKAFNPRQPAGGVILPQAGWRARDGGARQPRAARRSRCCRTGQGGREPGRESQPSRAASPMPWLVRQALPPVLPVRVRASAWPAGHKAPAGACVRGQRPAAEAAERSRRGHPHPLARSGWRGPRTDHRPSRIPPVAVRPDRGRRGRGSAVRAAGRGPLPARLVLRLQYRGRGPGCSRHAAHLGTHGRCAVHGSRPRSLPMLLRRSTQAIPAWHLADLLPR